MDDNYIFPFCIYHYVNIINNTFLSFLTKGIKNNKNNKFSVNCGNPPIDNAHFASKFYAVNPSLVPSPKFLQNFVVLQRNSFPYDIYDIHILQDIFNDIYNEDKNNLSSEEQYTEIYFSAWTKPIPNSTPLYLHETGNNIFMSFDPNPPPSCGNYNLLRTGYNINKKIKKNKNIRRATEYIISPIYVLSDKVFTEGFNNIKFQCLDGVVVPYKNEIPNLFSYNPLLKEPLPINKATVDCNEIPETLNRRNVITLEKIIKDINIKDKKYSSSIKFTLNNNTKYIIILTVVILLIIIMMIMIIIINRKL